LFQVHLHRFGLYQANVVKNLSKPASNMSTVTMTSPPLADVLTEKPRISSIDLVRGIVMVIMALDHTRDFYHAGALTSDPTNLATTTPLLFFTRWVTHFCAPAFVFLAGTSIHISAQRKSRKDLSIFLLTRGLWLIFLEVVVMRFSFFFNFYYDVTIFQVIWAIGASMICMAALIYLSEYAILGIGLLITFAHNATDAVALQPGEPLFPLWAFLRQTGFMSIAADKNLMVMYPLLPWLGIMMLGYALGKLYRKEVDPGRRRKYLLSIGLGCVALFFVLRMINVYGDPNLWSIQKNALYTIMSFVNCTKYPVSLLYTLMTLGPVLITLALLERRQLNILKPFTVFGRVPLFYYVLHFYIIHATALIFFLNKTGKSFSDLDFHFNKSFGGLTPESGYSLPWVYLAWAIIVVALYPLCRWYNKYKSTHANWWLSYI
jgi:uncharacterized membrane protein